MIQRSEIKELTTRLKEPRKFIQMIVGPRQVGKTTMVTQAGQTTPCVNFTHEGGEG